jgi:FMN phosphatase YigB (HAD superfamily)
MDVADLKREGTDATVVATGLMVHKTLTAAAQLEKVGVSVEVLDPRTLVPLDREAILASAAKTGRVVIASEDVLTCGFGAEVAALLAERGLYSLLSPVKRVCVPDTPHAHRITSIPGNIELLRTLRAAGFRTAIASGSSRPSILPVMDRFGIEVDAVSSAEDVRRGKPHPDLFLKAAEKLGVAPEDCIVVEDSDVGIRAPRAAGISALRYYCRLSPAG